MLTQIVPQEKIRVSDSENEDLRKALKYLSLNYPSSDYYKSLLSDTRNLTAGQAAIIRQRYVEHYEEMEANNKMRALVAELHAEIPNDSLVKLAHNWAGLYTEKLANAIIVKYSRFKQ